MAELKTKRTAASVTAFLKRVADDSRRRDCLTVQCDGTAAAGLGVGAAHETGARLSGLTSIAWRSTIPFLGAVVNAATCDATSHALKGIGT